VPTIPILSAAGAGESVSQQASVLPNGQIDLDPTWGGYGWQVAKTVNQNKFAATNITYPNTGVSSGSPITLNNAVAAGVTNVENILYSIGSSPFILLGYGQGAMIMSEILVQMQSGSLTAYMDNLLGAVMFGNPMRQSGHTFPNDPTGPTGTGVNPTLLSSTPTLWWDMTTTYDLFSNIPTNAGAAVLQDIWVAAGKVSIETVPAIITATLAVAQQEGSDILANLITAQLTSALSAGTALTDAVTFLLEVVANSTSEGHESYGTTLVGDTNLTFVQTAVNYINSLA
jgi:hypothetical protein